MELGNDLVRRWIRKISSLMRPDLERRIFSDGSMDEAFIAAIAELERKGINPTQEKIDEAIKTAVDEGAKKLTRDLKRRAPKMLRFKRRELQGFESRLCKTWQEPIDLLEMLWVMAFEAGQDFNHVGRAAAVQDKDVSFDALTRLHARACQVAAEVIALIKSGHASGAHARWRTLHEVAVVAIFISERGQDVANRYMLHGEIESYRALVEYQKHAESLGYEPFTDVEAKEITQRKDELLARFKTSFGTPYGWAAEALSMKDPVFSDIEKAVALDYHRPYYRLASHGIHPNPKGILFNLATSHRPSEVILAGPSNAGLADPGQCAAHSLQITTAALLNQQPSVEGCLILTSMKSLVFEIAESFVRVQKHVETLPSPMHMEG